MENNSLFFPMPDMQEMGKLDHVMGVEADLMERDIAGRVYNPKLTALRAQNCGLPISQFTNKSIAVILAAGVAVDLNLPSGTKMIRFNSDGFFFASRNGRAQIPTVALVTGQAEADIGSFCPATDTYYYVEEVHQLSIISDLQVRVTVECFSQI